MRYGSPEWFACRTGLMHYLHKLAEDERILFGSVRERNEEDRKAEAILRSHIAAQRRSIHQAISLLEEMT